MDSLRRLEKEMKKCVRCGACRAYCPAFLETGREPAVARGKIAVAQHLLHQDLPWDGLTREIMANCLLCGNCTMNCPNEVATDEIVIGAREALAEKRGLPFLARAVSTVLRFPRGMRLGAAIAYLLSPLVFRKIPATSGLRLRFPVPFLGNNRHIPPLASKPFLSSCPEVLPGKPGAPSVVFFVGCMNNFVYPQIGEALLALLQGMGCTIFIPKGQQCCGLPALSGGDLETSRRLAEKNLAALGSFSADFVVSACASCGGALHKFYPAVLGKAFPELQGQAEHIAGKTLDASTLLTRLGWQPRGSGSGEPLAVTYHDPCHLRARGVTKDPRDLLKHAPGVKLVEMEGADRCCGLGGTFNVHHYETSMGINRGKTAAILRTGAQAVVSGCPGCMMQLSDGLKQQGSAMRVMHTLEVLANE